jgi:hypothetical protein
MIEEEKTMTTINNVSSEEKEAEVEEFETKKRARKRKLPMTNTKTKNVKRKFILRYKISALHNYLLSF